MTKPTYLPKENFPKIEEVKEIENQIPTYEEFLKNYQVDQEVSESYESELNSYGDIGIVKGYGPCYKCGRGELTFELEIVLKNSRGGRKRTTVYDIVDALRVASKIERREGFWDDGNPSFSSRERESLVNRIINSIDEHVSDSKSINRTVVNDVDDDDCLIL